MVARAGVQPATFALGVRCSMQLSYRATFPSVAHGLAVRSIRASPRTDGSVSSEDCSSRLAGG